MSKEFVADGDIAQSLDVLGFKITANEGRLMLSELLLKAGAGYYNSHTEEAFLRSFDLLKADRAPNKKGRRFLCAMFYTHSNGRPECYGYMTKYRQPTNTND